MPEAYFPLALVVFLFMPIFVGSCVLYAKVPEVGQGQTNPRRILLVFVMVGVVVAACMVTGSLDKEITTRQYEKTLREEYGYKVVMVDASTKPNFTGVKNGQKCTGSFYEIDETIVGLTNEECTDLIVTTPK